MEHLSNDHEDHPNQLENSPNPLKNCRKLCIKMGHLFFSLKDSQWKLRQAQRKRLKTLNEGHSKRQIQILRIF